MKLSSNILLKKIIILFCLNIHISIGMCKYQCLLSLKKRSYLNFIASFHINGMNSNIAKVNNLDILTCFFISSQK